MCTAQLRTKSCGQDSRTWHCRRHLSVGRETALQPLLLLLGSHGRRCRRLCCRRRLPSVTTVTVHALQSIKRLLSRHHNSCIPRASWISICINSFHATRSAQRHGLSLPKLAIANAEPQVALLMRHIRLHDQYPDKSMCTCDTDAGCASPWLEPEPLACGGPNFDAGLGPRATP